MAHAFNEHRIATITGATLLMSLAVRGSHVEEVSFYVIDTSSAFTVRPPRLVKHNPHLEWSYVGLDSFLPFQCLCTALPSMVPKEEDSLDLSFVPMVYLDLQQVFGNSRAFFLPPHGPSDCANDLLPGTSLPRVRIYPLSVPERKTIAEYISSALALDIIQPSLSPNWTYGAPISWLGSTSWMSGR